MIHVSVILLSTYIFADSVDILPNPKITIIHHRMWMSKQHHLQFERFSWDWEMSNNSSQWLVAWLLMRLKDGKVPISDLRKSRAFSNPSLGSTLHHQVPVYITDEVKMRIILVCGKNINWIFRPWRNLEMLACLFWIA